MTNIGILFGADYDGGVCPAPDHGSCFTQYHELDVRYVKDGGKAYAEMRLRKISRQLDPAIEALAAA